MGRGSDGGNRDPVDELGHFAALERQLSAIAPSDEHAELVDIYFRLIKETADDAATRIDSAVRRATAIVTAAVVIVGLMVTQIKNISQLEPGSGAPWAVLAGLAFLSVAALIAFLNSFPSTPARGHISADAVSAVLPASAVEAKYALTLVILRLARDTRAQLDARIRWLRGASVALALGLGLLLGTAGWLAATPSVPTPTTPTPAATATPAASR